MDCLFKHFQGKVIFFIIVVGYLGNIVEAFGGKELAFAEQIFVAFFFCRDQQCFAVFDDGFVQGKAFFLIYAVYGTEPCQGNLAGNIIFQTFIGFNALLFAQLGDILWQQ